MRILLALAAGAAAALLPATAFADVIRVVPGEGNPIQAAFDAAQDGDTILVTKGTYPPGATMSGKTDIVVRGAGRPLILGEGGFEAGTALTFTEVSGLTIKGLSFADCARGIVTADCEDVAILGCRFDGMYYHGIDDTTSDGYLVQGCLVENSALSGIQLSRYQGNVGTSRAVVRGNTIRNMPDVGMDLAGEAIVVQGNQVVSGGSAGIRILNGTAAHDAVIRSNRVHGPSHGLVVTGTSQTVTGNRLTGCQADALLVYVSGSVIERNVIADTLGNGIFLSGSGNEFLRNRVSESGAYDFGSYDSEAANTFVGNRFATTQFNVPYPDPL